MPSRVLTKALLNPKKREGDCSKGNWRRLSMLIPQGHRKPLEKFPQHKRRKTAWSWRMVEKALGDEHRDSDFRMELTSRRDGEKYFL